MTLPALKKRAEDAHKWAVGSVLVVAGSPGMSGAAFLTAKAALRSGAGVVVTACSEAVYPILAQKHTCVMVRAFPATHHGALSSSALDAILELSERFDAVVVGPGLGRERTTSHLVRELVATLSEKKVLLDADGIFAFAGQAEKLDRDGLVLTPHEGELRTLLGIERGHEPPTREAWTELFHAKAPRAVLVLKGRHTLISRRGERATNDTGNPGLATAGSGDVLSGLVGALLASGLSPWDAARLGVWLHGRAADIVTKDVGAPLFIASDLLAALPRAIAERLQAQGGAA